MKFSLFILKKNFLLIWYFLKISIDSEKSDQRNINITSFQQTNTRILDWNLYWKEKDFSPPNILVKQNSAWCQSWKSYIIQNICTWIAWNFHGAIRLYHILRSLIFSPGFWNLVFSDSARHSMQINIYTSSKIVNAYWICVSIFLMLKYLEVSGEQRIGRWKKIWKMRNWISSFSLSINAVGEGRAAAVQACQAEK